MLDGDGIGVLQDGAILKEKTGGQDYWCVCLTRNGRGVDKAHCGIEGDKTKGRVHLERTMRVPVLLRQRLQQRCIQRKQRRRQLSVQRWHFHRRPRSSRCSEEQQLPQQCRETFPVPRNASSVPGVALGAAKTGKSLCGVGSSPRRREGRQLSLRCRKKLPAPRTPATPFAMPGVAPGAAKAGNSICDLDPVSSSSPPPQLPFRIFWRSRRNASRSSRTRWMREHKT